jgi:hypothetical protein
VHKIISTTWEPLHDLLVTTLSGKIDSNDVDTWHFTLKNAAAKIPDESSFKILVNLYGFEAETTAVHKKYRTIMPLFLADYGYRIGYLDMFPEAAIQLGTTRGIRCVAMANVHHNADKMNDYQNRFSSEHEQYFTDQEGALRWITDLRMK